MMETTAITAITQMTIPSNVRSDRTRFARREDKAMKTASPKFTPLYYGRWRQFVQIPLLAEEGNTTGRGRTFPGADESSPPWSASEEVGQPQQEAAVAEPAALLAGAGAGAQAAAFFQPAQPALLRASARRPQLLLRRRLASVSSSCGVGAPVSA